MPLLRFNKHAKVNLNKAIVDNNWDQAKSIVLEERESCQKWSKSVSGNNVTSVILPIHQACAAENVPLDFLVTLAHAFPEALKKTDSVFKRTPLHFALKSRASEEVIRFLVQCYPDGVGRKDSLGRVPLHYVMSNSLPINIVRYMVNACPELIAAADNQGWTPLHVAAYMAVSTEIVSMIVQCKPEVMKTKTSKGWTPLKCAQESDTLYTGIIIETLTAEEKKFDSSYTFKDRWVEDKEQNVFNQWGVKKKEAFVSPFV